jgi:hypothetical protein
MILQAISLDRRKSLLYDTRMTEKGQRIHRVTGNGWPFCFSLVGLLGAVGGLWTRLTGGSIPPSSTQPHFKSHFSTPSQILYLTQLLRYV